MRKILFTLLLMPLLLHSLHAQYRIEGEVFDHKTQQPVPGAHVRAFPDSVGAVTDANGFFVFQLTGKPDTVYVVSSFIGMESSEIRLVLSPKETTHHLHFYLNESTCNKCHEVDMILIEENALGKASAQVTDLVNQSFFEENLQGSFAKSLEKIAGVNTINVGVGIAKPVIRGLSSNRIVVNQNGIAQQGQQWGADHGLEIDALNVDRLELVKGPGSLLYGSDAMGGVINLLPERIAAHNTLKASVHGIYKSNNGHWGTSAHLSANLHNWFWQARYTRQEFGDYRIPTDSFVYNGFVLPIYENTLKNTAGKEENISLSFGTVQKWGVLRFTGSHFGLKSGIFSGAMGIPRAYDLQPDGDNRDIDLPAQSVSHLKTIINADFRLPKEMDLKLDLGYQRNLRREYSLAHLHNRPTDGTVGDLALQLFLQTFSGNLRFRQNLGAKWAQQYGLTAQYQNNQKSGFDYLLPDFVTLRTGLYALGEYQPSNRLQINAGLRLDYANNKTEAYEQPIYVDNGVTTLSLISPATHQHFVNLSASAGLWYAIKPDEWVFRVHLGKSFRVPYPSETVSNGVHHGTFRHEVGTPNLRSEHGYQLDLSSDWRKNGWEVELAGFFNYFNNYIYLSPTARFSPLPDAGQLYQYLQTDAIYTGGELSWRYRPWAFLRVGQAMEYVWNLNLKSGLGLPFTPPASLLSELRWELPKAKAWLDKAYAQLSYRYTFAQNWIDRNELATPAYHLLDFGVGTTLKIRKQPIIIGFQVQNLLNTPYLQHLSRYRLLNLPEQGRNFIVSLKVPILVTLVK